MPRAKQKTAFLGEQTVRILLGVPLMQAGWLIHALCDWIENDREPTREETPDDCIGAWIAIHDESVRIHESRKQQADAGRAGADKTNGERAANARRTNGERAANARQEEEEEKEEERDILRNESEVTRARAGKPASASVSDSEDIDFFSIRDASLVPAALFLVREVGNARMRGRLAKALRLLGAAEFRELLATFAAEIRAGEVPANPGATLNARLSAAEACQSLKTATP